MRQAEQGKGDETWVAGDFQDPADRPLRGCADRGGTGVDQPGDEKDQRREHHRPRQPSNGGGCTQVPEQPTGVLVMREDDYQRRERRDGDQRIPSAKRLLSKPGDQPGPDERRGDKEVRADKQDRQDSNRHDRIHLCVLLWWLFGKGPGSDRAMSCLKRIRTLTLPSPATKCGRGERGPLPTTKLNQMKGARGEFKKSFT